MVVNAGNLKEQRFESTDLWFYRQMLRIGTTWRHIFTIRKRQLNFFKHMMMNDELENLIRPGCIVKARGGEDSE